MQRNTPQIRPLSALFSVVALAAVFALAVPTAFGATARPAASNESEDAAEAVYSVVGASYSKQAKGRSIETDCSGRKNTFSCRWWIIKSAKEKRRASRSDSVARRGEGSQHTRSSRVYMSGYATATYNAKSHGFGIRLG